MKTILDLIYLLLLVALAPWVLFRILFQGKNRRGWGQKLFGLAPIRESNSRCVWIHAVSVGEVNLLTPLVNQMRTRFPDCEFAISTTTETGFDLACKKFPNEIVFFCPTDFSWAVKNTIGRIRPNLLLLTELELWPNLVSSAQLNDVPVALINGRISKKSFAGYKRFRFLFSWLLKQINCAIVQTEDYAKRLRALGMPQDRIFVCGNLKFDAMTSKQPALKSNMIANLANIQSDEFVFVAGSTQENEDRIAIDVFARLKSEFSNLRMLLVPRHPDRAHRLSRFFDQHSIPFAFRSQLDHPVSNSPVMVVDTIGELSMCWSRADLAYVGGSMGGRGGQNMIEPAAVGIPVCFGPETENFKDVVELLISRDAAKVVRDTGELEALIRSALNETAELMEMGSRAQQLVCAERGSTARTIEILKPLMSCDHQNPIKNFQDAA